MQDEPLHPPTHLGFGMLRVDPERPEHREALREALARGVDLFDLGDFVADPAGFAAKERCLRELVAEHADAGVRAIVRGSLGAAARFSPRSGFAGSSVPSAQIEWIYLVADPEFALTALEWDSERLYSGLARELDELEALAAKGAISGYGVGSAGFTYAKDDPEALALEPLVFGRENLDWDAAEPAALPANRRHFRYLEFPFNLYESGAATEENQSLGTHTETLFASARRWNLVTLARRPFDAVTEAGLRRLVAYPDHHRLDLDEAVRRTLEAALAAEADSLAKRNHARTLAGAPAAELDPLWAHRLRDQLKHVRDPEQWKEILRRRIEPDLEKIGASENVSAPSSDSKVASGLEVASGLGRYLDAMEALLLSVRLWCEKAAAERNERLRARLFEAAPTLGRRREAGDRDLARVALRIYRSIPELDYVLVGMRSPNYVRSLIETEAERRLPPEEVRAALIAARIELGPEPQKGFS